MDVGSGRNKTGGVEVNSKGFVYTLFVFIVISLVTLLIVFPLNLRPYQNKGKKIRIDEEYYFLKSVESDLSRAYDISIKRGCVALTNQIISSGKELENPKYFLNELILNGTFNSTNSNVMENSSISDWVSKISYIAKNSGYNFGMFVTKYKINASTFPYIFLNYTQNISLEDSRSNSKFNPLYRINKKMNISNLEDPLFFLRTNGEKTSSYKQCSYQFRAKYLGSGTQEYYSGANWTSGKAALFLNNENVSSTADRGSKIAIINNLCEYPDSQISYLEEFNGIVSETAVNLSNPCGKGITLNNFIGGASDLDTQDLSNNMTVVMNSKQVWINNIVDELHQGCYFYSERGPDFFARAENKLTGSENGAGIGHFINVLNLPSELQKSASSLDYVYWNSSAYGSISKIKGVSNYESWFRLDQFHINLWNLSSLVY